MSATLPGTDVPPHPAKFSRKILDAIEEIVAREWEHLGGEHAPHPVKIIDPFAGVGLVHRLADHPVMGHRYETVGIELEPEWAAADPRTLVGDALSLPFETGSFHAGVTSPCYGNRMADHHEARDPCKACSGEGTIERVATPDEVDNGYELGIAFDRCSTCRGTGLSKRNTYRHQLGRMPTPGSTAVLPWGPTYKALHRKAWDELVRVVIEDGLLVVNVSNHMILDEEQEVVEWHLNEFLVRGCRLVEARRVKTPRNGQGANGDVRVDGELVLVLRTPRQRRLL